MSIDAIAGLEQLVVFSDTEQAAFNGYRQSMNDEGRAALVSTVKLMSGSPGTRIEKDRPTSYWSSGPDGKHSIEGNGGRLWESSPSDGL